MEFRTCTPTASPPPAPQHRKQRQLLAGAAPDTGGVCRLAPEKTLRQIPPAPMDKALAPSQGTTGGLDLGDPQLPVNFVSPTYRPPEKLVPRPPFRPKLKSNPWISQHFQKPGYLSYVDRQLALRRLAEKKNEEFHFPPLLTCLENIQIFVDHIRSGAQFDGALTTEEHQALAWVHKTAAQLAKVGVPLQAHRAAGHHSDDPVRDDDRTAGARSPAEQSCRGCGNTDHHSPPCSPHTRRGVQSHLDKQAGHGSGPVQKAGRKEAGRVGQGSALRYAGQQHLVCLSHFPGTGSARLLPVWPPPPASCRVDHRLCAQRRQPHDESTGVCRT